MQNKTKTKQKQQKQQKQQNKNNKTKQKQKRITKQEGNYKIQQYNIAKLKTKMTKFFY